MGHEEKRMMFRRMLGTGSLLAAFVVCFPASDLQAQNKKKAAPNKTAPAVDSAKLAAGEYVGFVKQTPGNDRLFTIEVPDQQVVPTGISGGRGRTPVRVNYKTTTTKHEIEFQASEKVKVRTTILPEQFDDKGNIKKHTAKELAELKGKDKNLPGYESSLERLETGQVVRVTLKAAPTRGAKDKDKDAPADARVDKKMQAAVIVITKESGSGGAMPKGKKK